MSPCHSAIKSPIGVPYAQDTIRVTVFIAVAQGATSPATRAVRAAALVKLGASRQEINEMLAVAVYMGGGPSLMYAASAIAAFDEFAQAAA